MWNGLSLVDSTNTAVLAAVSLLFRRSILVIVLAFVLHCLCIEWCTVFCCDFSGFSSFFMFYLCYLYSLVKMHCGVLLV